MNVEVGQYITNGAVDLLVVNIKDYEGKKYAQLLDEKNEILYFCEMTREGEGWKFQRVTSDNLCKALIIHFSEIKEILKGEKSVDEI